jgi:hypothetical protein
MVASNVEVAAGFPAAPIQRIHAPSPEDRRRRLARRGSAAKGVAR